MTDVLVRVEEHAGRRALKVLTLDMVRIIDQALEIWEQDPAVRRMALDGTWTV